jgi:phosphoribosylanthranilate isomerase
MTRVKVCGFTRAADVRAGVAAGVDAFGFNFAQGPRRITPEQGRDLVRQLPAYQVPVALFVDADEDTVLAAMATSRCQVIQLHGDEPPELAERLRRHFPVVRAVRVRDAATLDALADYPADALLLDAYVPAVAGGSGHSWDHRLLIGRDLGKPVILAGGLRADTVGAAVAALAPYGVDTASGVESAPGIKDAERMRAFVVAARGGSAV